MSDMQYTVVLTSNVLYNISCYLERSEEDNYTGADEKEIHANMDKEISKGNKYYEHLSTLGNEGNTIFLMSDFSSLEAMVCLRNIRGKYSTRLDLNLSERWSLLQNKLSSEGVTIHSLETYQASGFSDIIRGYIPRLLYRLILSDPMDLYIYGGALRYRAKEVLGPSHEFAKSIYNLKNSMDNEWLTISREIVELTELNGRHELPDAKVFD